MKKLLLILTVITVFTSCRGIDSVVDSDIRAIDRQTEVLKEQNKILKEISETLKQQKQ